jgi:hypothetical protein
MRMRKEKRSKRGKSVQDIKKIPQKAKANRKLMFNRIDLFSITNTSFSLRTAD